MKSTEFSIIIPLYNKEKHISKTLSSIKAQTYKNYEIVVIDDGSTDQSVSVISSMNIGNLSIYEQPNSGVSAARNYGIEKAQYEWIVFLDADDEIKPGYLSVLNQSIISFPDHRVFTAAYEFYSHNSSNILPYFHGIPPRGESGLIENYFQSAIKGKNVIICSSTCVHKEVFETSGTFPEGYKRGEDLDFFFRIALNYKIVFHNSPLVIYHQNVAFSATSKLEHVQDIFPYHHWFKRPRNKFNLPFQNRYIINRIAKAVYAIAKHGKIHHLLKYFIR